MCAERWPVHTATTRRSVSYGATVPQCQRQTLTPSTTEPILLHYHLPATVRTQPNQTGNFRSGSHQPAFRPARLLPALVGQNLSKAQRPPGQLGSRPRDTSVNIWIPAHPKPPTETNCGTRQKIYFKNFKKIFRL